MVEQELLNSDLHSVVEHMEAAYNQFKGNELAVGLPDFKLAPFWCNLCSSIKKISTEVTKICLMYSKAPLPTDFEAKELLKSMDAAFVDVLAIFYTLPKDQGMSLYEVVHKSVLEVIGSVVTVIKSLKKNGIEAQKYRLKLTGLVWEACEAVEELPQNNLAVIHKLVKDEEALVFDAVQEIEEEVKSGLQQGVDVTEEDDSSSWSSSDRVLLSPCIGLVKTARSCLKKINQTIRSKGQCNTADEITQLDAIARTIKEFSPAVDNFIESVYPPMSRTQVQNTASIVVGLIREVLNMSKASHYITEDDHSWIDFLLKAVDHNNNKLQSSLLMGSE